nr:cyclic AMP response element-binding protein A-like [Onthophagus taurus]
MQEVLRVNSSADLQVEWNFLDKEISPVLHDRLMTDAALGTRPIKTEHSYSLASDGDSLPDSPISSKRIEDMEEDFFPMIPTHRLNSEMVIKDEPLSETDSVHSSCPSSPQQNDDFADSFLADPPKRTCGIIRNSNLMLTSNNVFAPKFSLSKINVKIEPGTRFHLPPTPPSCSSSEDSEDNSHSPCVRKTNARVMVTHTTRQPINTPLISTQPKGSTGTLILTEEEKRTLIAEGYPVPTRLPLTKAEEKSLKKIRRKIKNKISAQESRRKKKEYMDQLERKVDILVSENSEYKKKIETLEDSNSSLMNQLAKLQALVTKTHPQLMGRFAK